MQRGSMMFYPNLLRNNVTNFTTYSRGTSVFFCFKKNFEKKKKNQPTGSRLPRVASLSISARVAHHRTAGGLPSSLSLESCWMRLFSYKNVFVSSHKYEVYLSLSLCGTIYFYLSNTYRKEKSFAWKSISIIRSGRVRRTISIQKKAILRRIVFFSV